MQPPNPPPSFSRHTPRVGDGESRRTRRARAADLVVDLQRPVRPIMRRPLCQDRLGRGRARRRAFSYSRSRRGGTATYRLGKTGALASSSAGKETSRAPTHVRQHCLARPRPLVGTRRDRRCLEEAMLALTLVSQMSSTERAARKRPASPRAYGASDEERVASD